MDIYRGILLFAQIPQRHPFPPKRLARIIKFQPFAINILVLASFSLIFSLSPLFPELIGDHYMNMRASHLFLAPDIREYTMRDVHHGRRFIADTAHLVFSSFCHRQISALINCPRSSSATCESIENVAGL